MTLCVLGGAVKTKLYIIMISPTHTHDRNNTLISIYF